MNLAENSIVNVETAKECDTLLDLLEREVVCYQSLLAALEKEKKAIVASDLSELSINAQEKEALLGEIKVLEKKRQSIIENLAKWFECSSRDLTITRLAERTAEPHAVRFKNISSELRPLADAAHSANSANQALLSHAIELIRSSFAFINNLLAANAIYYRSGRMQQNDHSGKVICSNI